jgi:stress response protein YsnF
VADVSKSARVTEEIQARKKTETDRQTISGQVRKEDVEIERERGDVDRT